MCLSLQPLLSFTLTYGSALTITLNGSAFLLDGREGLTPKHTEQQWNGNHVHSTDVHSAANRIHCSQSVGFLCTWSGSVAGVARRSAAALAVFSTRIKSRAARGEHQPKQETNY